MLPVHALSRGAAMPQAGYPIQMVGGVPVVAAPAAISVSNADQLRIALLEAAARGTGTMVLDMTSARHCDPARCARWNGLSSAPLASHGELRLVIANAAIHVELAAAGLDRLVRCYASVSEAVSLVPADRPQRARRPDPSVASPA